MGFFGPTLTKKKGSKPSSVASAPPPKVDHLGYALNGPPQPQIQASVPPVGLPPAPLGWVAQPSGPPPPYQTHRPCPPIIVNQHYYLSPLPSNNPYPYSGGSGAISKPKPGTEADIANSIVSGNVVHQVFDDGLPSWHCHASQLLNQGAAMYDQIQSRFNDVMTLIDRDRLLGNEKELFTYQSLPAATPPSSVASQPPTLEKHTPKKSGKKDAPKGQTTAVASSLISGGYFAKVELYANSRLPMNLPPLRLYIPTYPLLCLAAQFSERVYEKPRGAERNAHVDADWRTGTKAMCIKSVPMDHMNTIVFAIRGTATFMDWAVNLNTAPASPSGFLDDTGNFCHAGFLSAARKMVKPVAARLRQLLEEDPHRSSYSLLITGHSAGGAVAALLYSHMLATSKAASSELNILTGCFKRVHCITFGTPPVSLLPLTKPDRPQFKKSLFMSFVNEGDPVARADKAYVKSLLELFATPSPSQGQLKAPTSKLPSPPPSPSLKHSKPSRDKKSKSSSTAASVKPSSKASVVSSHSAQSASSKSSSSSSTSKTKPAGPVWQVPPSTLSSAGRIIVLRSGDPKARLKKKKTVEERLNEGVVAQITSDEQLRGVIWGDPVCHVMSLYAGRIETLAVGAVTAKGY
ncbi:Alpha/Beta hydrolase protein [Pseudomassariella vexata]|uniref:Alpha/Beta hydrolase protein n=1 Tax=Pseudomassariella vexata TaxID=1141098 RepID=A0A1Y2EHW0_9PEZI|nr:Alpha/Beta hydrolase protein [Pseudomassariella vexata]ORY71017.1 Alpha/Beta hydrolase protein [Pseudomassariella vexata]